MAKALTATHVAPPAPVQPMDAPVSVVDDGLTLLQRRFKEMHDVMLGPMVSLAMRSLKRRDAAEEVFQEVMAEMWTRLHDGEMTIDQLTRPAIVRAVRFRTLNAVKKDQSLVSLTEEVEATGIVPRIGPWSDPTAINLREDLERILQQLTPQRRMAWVLHQQGYMRADIAQALGVTPETAKYHLKASMKIVREALVGAGWDEYAQYLERRYNQGALPQRAEGPTHD